MKRVILLLSVVWLVGCGKSTPPPPVVVKTTKLPPEVEFDPVTAAQKYKEAAHKKAARR